MKEIKVIGAILITATGLVSIVFTPFGVALFGFGIYLWAEAEKEERK